MKIYLDYLYKPVIKLKILFLLNSNISLTQENLHVAGNKMHKII